MTHTVILHNPRQRVVAKQIIDRAPLDYVVTIKEPSRTLEQNNLFWEVMSDLSTACPEGRMWTKETWRDAILHAMGHKVQFEEGLEGSGPFPTGFRSSRLSKRQMSECIEYAFAYGASHQVIFTIDRRKFQEVFG